MTFDKPEHTVAVLQAITLLRSFGIQAEIAKMYGSNVEHIITLPNVHEDKSTQPIPSDENRVFAGS